MGKLDPERGGGGVEDSEVGFTKEEAKANWEEFKVKLDSEIESKEEEAKALWVKAKAYLDALFVKLGL